MEYRDGVADEKGILDRNIEKLSKFIQSNVFWSLDRTERTRLTDQLEIMIKYSEILEERIFYYSSKIV